MKNIILISSLLVLFLTSQAQNNKSDVLQKLEQNQQSSDNKSITATLKSSSRLFGDKNDLTSVIFIIPSGSVVNVIGMDSTFYLVKFEDAEGYILKRHAEINDSQVNVSPVSEPVRMVQENQPAPDKQVNRFSSLENKYGSNMAARLYAGKIWKGMTAEMVKDSWGSPVKVNRVISGNLVKEEWIYKNTWLYIENNELVEWGPIRK